MFDLRVTWGPPGELGEGILVDRGQAVLVTARGAVPISEILLRDASDAEVGDLVKRALGMIDSG